MTARVGTPPVSIFEKTTDSTCPRSPSTPSTPTSDDNGTREVSTAPPAQRVSFYVQAADDMLEAVFRHEAFLFSPKEQHALRRFQLLDYQSRYLFMRLFLRKHGWIRLDGIGYENDVKDLESACRDLWQKIEFTPSPPAVEETKSELKLEPFSRSSSSKVEDPNVIDLTMSDDEEEDLRTRGTRPTEKKKKLGDCEEDDSNMDLTRLAEDKEVLAVEDPEIALSLLTMEELVALGKRMKVSLPAGKTTRGEWTKALLRTSNQSTLSFFPSQTSTSNAKGKGKQVGFGVGYDTKGNKLKQSSVVARQALKSIGPVIRLSPTYVSLFNRLSLVYHRTSYTATSSQPNKTSSLTASLLARFGKRRYPDYIVSRSFSIFPSRKTLKQFEAAMEIEKKVEESLEGIWGPGVAKRGEKESVDEKRARFLEGAKIWEEVEDEWKELCVEAETEMKAEDDGDERRRLYYRRRFHPGWPLSRAAYKAAACYAKLGDHEREVEILRFLLAQTSFRRGKRGDWYDRLALVLMKYPLGEELVLIKDKESKPKKKERLLRERREEALRVCETGLEDPFTHLIYKSSLQRRIARIESALDVPKDERRSFQVLLTKSKQRTMEGERLDDPTIGKKSLWRATDGDEVSVEELVLEQYVKEGWKGFHSENGVLTSIFALVFWDIIFAPVDGVFETAFQSAPLDLATDAFAIVRRPAVDARLAAVARGEAATFLKATDDRERPLNTWAVGINWERFSQEDLTEIVDCIGGPALASILTVFVEEYGHRTGGIPDLCLWNPSTSSVLFSEVKGPGDKLSETQKVWIEVLLSSGVGVEVCRVVESRKLDDQAESDGDEGEESEESGGSGKVKKGKGKRKRAAPRSRSRSTSTAVKRAKTEEIELSDSD